MTIGQDVGEIVVVQPVLHPALAETTGFEPPQALPAIANPEAAIRRAQQTADRARPRESARGFVSQLVRAHPQQQTLGGRRPAVAGGINGQGHDRPAAERQMEGFKLPVTPALQDLPFTVGPIGANPNLAGCGRQQRVYLVGGRAVRVDTQAVLRAEALCDRPVFPVEQAIVLSADPDATLEIRSHAFGEGDGPSVFRRQRCPAMARVPQDFTIWPEDRPHQPGGILTDGVHRRELGCGTDSQQIHDTGLQLAQAAAACADPHIPLTVLHKDIDGLLGHGRCGHSSMIETEQPRLPRSEPQESVTIFVKCRRGHHGRVGRQNA